LKAHNFAQRDIDIVWTAIALRTTPGIPARMHEIIALVTSGIEMDVLGIACHECTRLNATPLSRSIPLHLVLRKTSSRLFASQAETTFGNVKADVLAAKHPMFRSRNFCSVIRASAWLARGLHSGLIRRLASKTESGHTKGAAAFCRSDV
jgi:hypothetical protein